MIEEGLQDGGTENENGMINLYKYIDIIKSYYTYMITIKLYVYYIVYNYMHIIFTRPEVENFEQTPEFEK